MVRILLARWITLLEWRLSSLAGWLHEEEAQRVTEEEYNKFVRASWSGLDAEEEDADPMRCTEMHQ